MKRRLVLRDPDGIVCAPEGGPGLTSDPVYVERVPEVRGSGKKDEGPEDEAFRAEASAVWAEFGRREARLSEREADLQERERALSEGEALFRAQRKLAVNRSTSAPFVANEELSARMESLEQREAHVSECERTLETKFMELMEREAELEQREEELAAGTPSRSEDKAAE